VVLRRIGISNGILSPAPPAHNPENTSGLPSVARRRCRLPQHAAAGLPQRLVARRLPAEVVEHIVAKTDGVPLYVEELTKMLLEADLLRQDADHYVLTGPLVSVTIPDTLQDSLMARLDQMHTAKEIAQFGAVLGREFTYEILQALSPLDEASLQDGLAQLVAAELLYQRGRPPRARYIFKHALIQDAAYASLLKSTRQQMHQRVAERLEMAYAELTTTQPEWVAHHYTEAGCATQAVRYWYAAGRLASQRSAHVEAIAHLTRGLEVLQGLPETIERDRQELDLQLALGRGLMVTKGLAAIDAEDAYTRAWELCQHVEAPSEQIAALAGLRRMVTARGDLQTARDLAEQLLELAQRHQDTPLLLEAYYSLGVVLQQLGEVASARTQFEQGMTLDKQPMLDAPIAMQRVGIDPSVGIRTHAGRMLWIMGYPEQAVQRDREALTLAEQRAHPYSQGFALLWSAILYAYRRESHISQKQAEAVIALAAAHEFEGWLTVGTMLCGWVQGIQGNYEEGLAQIQQGLSSLSIGVT
jgi:tetratricopeptide (TPR) repeat protein